MLALVAATYALVMRDKPTATHAGMHHVRRLHTQLSPLTGSPTIETFDDVWETYRIHNPTGSSIWIAADPAWPVIPSSPPLVAYEYHGPCPGKVVPSGWNSSDGCLKVVVQTEIKAGSALTVAIPARIRGSSSAITAIRIPYNYRPWGARTTLDQALGNLREELFDESSDGCIYLELQPELPGIPTTPDVTVNTP